MRRSLVGATGRGNTLSPQQRKLLTDGDIEGVLELHRAFFGLVTMENEDEGEDGDEDEDDENGEDEDSSDEDDSGDGGSDEDDEDEDGDDPDPKDLRIQEISREAKKYRLRNREYRKRIADLEAKLNKSGNGDDEGDEDDKKSKDANVSSREIRDLTKKNEELLIRLEFMANTKHSWKNPKAALRLLDLSDVEIDEDGEVDGLDEAIEALAKSDPYLLAEAKPPPKKRRSATGQSTGSGTPGRRSSASREKLMKKYPALRR